jgi:glycosyltransferase involved in cell wall biosynthesis
MGDRLSVLFLEHYPEIAGGQQGLITLLENLDRDRVDASVLCEERGAFRESVERIDSVETYTASMNPPGVTERTDTDAHRSVTTAAGHVVPALVALLAVVRVVRSEDCDVVHCNTFKMAVVAALASFVLPAVTFVYYVQTSRENADHGLLDEFVLRRMDRAIANSEYTRSTYEAFDEKFTVIHNPIDFEALSSDSGTSESFRRSIGIPDDTVLVCAVGRIAPVKRYEEFIAVAEAVAADRGDVHFCAVGGDGLDGDYVDRIHRTRDRSEHSGRISLRGYREDIGAVYRAADVLLHPAALEGMGRVVVEAQYFGVPVVAVESGGIPEIVEHGESGYLAPPGDIDALTEYVERLAEDDNLRFEFGQRGTELVEERFDAETICRRYESLLDRIV